MATYHDAKTGWEIFRASNFSLTRDEINVYLQQRGLSPISPRTYVHYKKLRRYGYNEYVPINQLDVKTLKDPLWDEAVRNRYPIQHSQVPIQLEMVLGDERIAVRGYTVQLSPAVLRCRFPFETWELFQDSRLLEHRGSIRVTVWFPSTEQRFAAEVERISKELPERFVMVTMRFLTLAPVELVTRRTVLPASTAYVRFVPHSTDSLLSEAVRRLYWLFQSFEASRVACEELLYDWDLDRFYAMPSTRVKRLSMESPLEVVVLLALPAAWLVRTILDLRIRYHAGSYERERARRLRIGNDFLEECSKDLKQRLLSRLDQPVTDLPQLDGQEETLGRWRDVIRNQLIPALDELLDDSSGEIDIDIGNE